MPVFGFNPSSYTRQESDSGEFQVCVQLSSQGSLPEAITLRISTEDGTAVGMTLCIIYVCVNTVLNHG